MSKKVICALCRCKLNKDEAFVKHAGKHNTYYCDENCYRKAVKRKKLKEENKKLREGLTVQN